ARAWGIPLRELSNRRRAVVHRVATTLRHRGPNDQGITWTRRRPAHKSRTVGGKDIIVLQEIFTLAPVRSPRWDPRGQRVRQGVVRREPCAGGGGVGDAVPPQLAQAGKRRGSSGRIWFPVRRKFRGRRPASGESQAARSRRHLPHTHRAVARSLRSPSDGRLLDDGATLVRV